MLKFLKAWLAILLLALPLHAAEINDFDPTDANNTARWPEGMAFATVNDSARADEGILARFWKDINGSLTTTGAANVYAVSANQTLSAYYTGLWIRAKANFTNTGAATMNFDTLGAKTVVKEGATALVAGDIVSGKIYDWVYDGTNIQLMQPSVLTSALLDIHATTQLTALDVADELLVYDASATANRRILVSDFFKVVNVLTAETAPAIDDLLPLYDTSAGTTDKIRLDDMLKVINSLTEDTTPDTTADFLLSYDSSAGGVKKVTPANIAAGALIAIIQDQKSSGTNGGTFTSGADQTRTLNTLVYNRNSTVSLASNRFTLPAGTWEIEWKAPGYIVGSHQSFLYNFTGSVEVQRGSTAFNPTSDSDLVYSMGSAVVTIGSPTAYEIRHRCNTTRSTDGFGPAASFSTEIYTMVTIHKQ